MKNKKELTQECEQAIERYREEQRKFDKLLSQFVSVGCLESGKEIKPVRPYDADTVKRAERKLDKVRKEMDEACDRLYKAYH